jgi:hypothetical protein
VTLSKMTPSGAHIVLCRHLLLVLMHAEAVTHSSMSDADLEHRARAACLLSSPPRRETRASHDPIRRRLERFNI